MRKEINYEILNTGSFMKIDGESEICSNIFRLEKPLKLARQQASTCEVC